MDYVVLWSGALGREVAFAKNARGLEEARRDRPDLDVWTWNELRLLGPDVPVPDLRLVDAARRALSARVVDPSVVPRDRVRTVVRPRKGGGETTFRVPVHVRWVVSVERSSVSLIPEAFLDEVRTVQEKLILRGSRAPVEEEKT